MKSRYEAVVVYATVEEDDEGNFYADVLFRMPVGDCARVLAGTLGKKVWFDMEGTLAPQPEPEIIRLVDGPAPKKQKKEK